MAINPLALYVGAAVATAAAVVGVSYDRWSAWQGPADLVQPRDITIAPPPQQQSASQQPATEAEQPAQEQAAQQPETQAEQPAQQPTAEQPVQPQAETQKAEQPAIQQKPAQQPAETQQQAAIQKSDGQAETGGSGSQEAPSAEAAVPPVPAEQDLSFDIARVEGDGAAVIAGRSRPGADIELKLDGTVIGRARANERGEWVVVPDRSIAKGDHQLNLEARGPDGEVKVADQSVIIKVPENADDKPLIVLSEPSKPSQVLQAPAADNKTVIAQQEQPPAQQPTSEPATQPKASEPTAQPQTAEQSTQPSTGEAAKAAEEAARQETEKAVQMAAEEAARQEAAKQEAEKAAQVAAEEAAKVEAARQEAEKAAQMAAKEAARQEAAKQEAEKAAQTATEEAARQALNLDSVDYDSGGDMMFSGRSAPDAGVRLYVDNDHLADTRADASGNWTVEGQDRIAVGDHTLRVDSLDGQGKVVARIEVPFTRAGRDEVAALQSSRDLDVKSSEGGSGEAADTATGEQAAKTEQSATAEVPAKTEQPATGTQEVAKTEQPATTAQEPAKAEQPATTTQEVAKTEQPATTTQEVAKTEQPATATQEVAKTEQPATTTQEVPKSEQPATSQEAAKSNLQADEQVAKVGRVVIQPGNNLWRISRIIYGHGVQYTTIYRANRDNIRDPDLIYPGQIFTTPGVVPPKYIDPRRRRPLTDDEMAAAATAAE